MYFAIRRLFEKRTADADTKDKEIKRLLGILEQQKADDILEWKEEVNASFCAIKSDTKAITEELHDRVVYEHCNERMDKLDVRVRTLGG